MTLAGLILQRYPSPEWATFFEVSNATGSGARRRADAVALGVWPSRGHAVVGFEFKEDRRDWLREKENPAKAEEVAAHCDQWWLVTGRDGIAKPEELPGPWGLLVANEDRTRLATVKPCVPFEGRDKGTMRRSFVSAMLRKVGETTVPKCELDRLVKEAAERAASTMREGAELRHALNRVEKLEAIVSAFKARTGVDLEGWRGPEKIAAAVQAVLDGESSRRALTDTRSRLSIAMKDIDAALAGWPALLDEARQ